MKTLIYAGVIHCIIFIIFYYVNAKTQIPLWDPYKFSPFCQKIPWKDFSHQPYLVDKECWAWVRKANKK